MLGFSDGNILRRKWPFSKLMEFAPKRIGPIPFPPPFIRMDRYIDTLVFSVVNAHEVFQSQNSYRAWLTQVGCQDSRIPPSIFLLVTLVIFKGRLTRSITPYQCCPPKMSMNFCFKMALADSTSTATVNPPTAAAAALVLVHTSGLRTESMKS